MLDHRAAVFIDRDGCLTEEVGYVNHVSRLRLLPRAADAVRRLNAAGVPAVMVTNQAGIARGYFTESVLHAVNAELVRQLAVGGARLDGLYVCTHHPDEGAEPYRMNCDCRKPRPGLLIEAAFKWHLNLDHSFVISDKWQDSEAARTAGCTSLLLQSPWVGKVHHDFVLPDLEAITEKILTLKHQVEFV